MTAEEAKKMEQNNDIFLGILLGVIGGFTAGFIIGLIWIN